MYAARRVSERRPEPGVFGLGMRPIMEPEPAEAGGLICIEPGMGSWRLMRTRCVTALVNITSFKGGTLLPPASAVRSDDPPIIFATASFLAAFAPAAIAALVPAAEFAVTISS